MGGLVGNDRIGGGTFCLYVRRVFNRERFYNWD